MNYQSFKKNSDKEYLGFCEEKGFVYSVKVNSGTYAVVAMQNGNVEVLITYHVKEEGTHE